MLLKIVLFFNEYCFKQITQHKYYTQKDIGIEISVRRRFSTWKMKSIRKFQTIQLSDSFRCSVICRNV